MKKDEEKCPLYGHSLPKGKRLSRLSDVEKMLSNSYVTFFRLVDSPYSCEEQEILLQIGKLLCSLLADKHPHPCSSCRFTEDDLALWGQERFFRLEFPSEKPFSVASRLHCLRWLADRLHCFFVNEGRYGSYSYNEKAVLHRMKKTVVHELRDTPHYDLFKGTHVRHVSEEEKQELELQKKDEARLKWTTLSHYNPLSQKYKAVKEEYMRLFLKAKSHSDSNAFNDLLPVTVFVLQSLIASVYV